MALLSAVTLLLCSLATCTVIDIDFDVPRRGAVCLTAQVGDTARFHWNEYHNLHELTDLSSYQSCSFSGANQLASARPNNGVFVQLNTPGDRFFACSKICSSNDHKVKICVGAASCSCTSSGSSSQAEERSNQAVVARSEEDSAQLLKDQVSAALPAALAWLPLLSNWALFLFLADR